MAQTLDSGTPGGMDATFTLVGELDLATADTFFNELVTFASETTGDVIVDCTEMTFIDSSGVKALIRAHRWLTREERTLELHRVNTACYRVFAVTRLHELIRVV
jgi:anti-sigma B factor antagonist